VAEGEKTEAPTPRRLQELRSQGRVVRSAELNSATALLTAFLVLQQLGGSGVAQLASFMQRRFSNLLLADFTDASVMELALSTGLLVLTVLGPVLLLLMAAPLVANVAQVGLHFSGKGLAPDFSHLNPLSGMQRLFSLRGGVELLKTLAKLAILAFVLWQAYQDDLLTYLSLGTMDPRASIPQLGQLVLGLGLRCAVVLLVIGGLDYGYQRWQFWREAQMTKQELKEEYRQTEGDQQTRSRMRSMARRLMRNRMMQAVPRADVVVTNPTHLAVALSYRAGETEAPQVVAKGADMLAHRIREIAREHGVPVLENKPLARALYTSVEVGDEIPVELFSAVAEVLAYVYSLREPAAE